MYRLDPAGVLGVKEGLNLPRYPTLPGRLRSKKADVPRLRGRRARPVACARSASSLPVEQVTETTVLGTGPEAAPAVVDLLQELGVL